ncbi:MAG: hypothetical protein FD174_2973 [Geobacteraceae bacterium]|nr:MAG: hypothetical protein FD174_2973 [Geobacteraceae bacterium]
MARKKKTADPLTDLLAAAQPETLIKLIAELAEDRPDVRRECFDFLKKHVSLTAGQKVRSEGEIVMALWWELHPDLEELDDCGGGDYGTEDHVAGLMCDIQRKLAGKQIEEKVRRQLLDEVLPFIKSANAGLDDPLYDLAYATCYSDEDWRRLAQALEAISKDWPTDHARRIYRKLGDREKYLELRRKKLVYGGDYHDLATFYWNEGNRKEALAVAEEGMKKGQGRMDELRKFLADRAHEGGNRERYLALQFEQTTDDLTLAKYKAFKKICTAEEWKAHEPKLLGQLDHAWASELLKILMHRKEYGQAVTVLVKEKYPSYAWDSADELRAAKQLETRFPEQILTYYLSGLGNLNSNATRKEYAERAKVMLKVRHMLVDVLKDENRWKTFAGKVKRDNLRRPAFQEEFAKVVPGWRELV